MKFKLGLMFSVACLLLMGCFGSTGNDDDSEEKEKTTPTVIEVATIEGKISTASLSQSLSYSITNNSTGSMEHVASGNVIAMAVDADGNVYLNPTDDNANFSIEVPGNIPYVLMFMNSAGQFLGTLNFNDDKTGLKTEQKEIDLGDITISGGIAASDNITALENLTQTHDIKSIDDLKMTAETNVISTMAYNQKVDGEMSFIKGDGDGDPLKIEDSWNLNMTKVEYNENLGKYVYKVICYNLIDTGGIGSVNPISEIRYYYYNGDGLVICNDEVGGDDDFEIPDRVKVGTWYRENSGDFSSASTFSESSSEPTTNFYFKVVKTFTNTEIPGLDDGVARNGFIQFNHIGTGERYAIFASGVGEVGYTTGEAIEDSEDNYKMKLIYKKTGDTHFGQKPTWLTDDFITLLPAESTYVPED